jgi:glutathione S-transferase
MGQKKSKNANKAMKLHVLPPSANCHSCIAVAKKLGLDVEVVDAMGKTRTPEFLAMNPCHVTPTLEFEDGSALWESNAILRYLCRISPDGGKLYPTDPREAAKIDMALDWRQTEMYQCLVSIGYIAFGFPQSDEQAQKDFKTLVEKFNILTTVFLKDKKFVFSDTPTIADLSIALPLPLIKARNKFWEAVPQEVKDYYKRVVDSFPEAKEYFEILDKMTTDFSGEGSELAPLE